jgi:hypothetical protein
LADDLLAGFQLAAQDRVAHAVRCDFDQCRRQLVPGTIMRGRGHGGQW